MKRFEATEIKIKLADFSAEELQILMQKIMERKMEFAYSKIKGELIGWSKDDDLYVLEKAKAGKVEITKNFPQVYDKNGDLVTPETLKKTDLKKLKTKEEMAGIKRAEQREAQIQEMREELNSKTKAELEKEHGVSSKLTKDKMIDEIIEQLFN